MSLLSDLKVAGLTGEGVKVTQRDSGEESILEAETIVLALGATPERGLVNDLKKEEIEFHAIGDCRKPKNIRQAIYEGALVGRQL